MNLSEEDQLKNKYLLFNKSPKNQMMELIDKTKKIDIKSNYSYIFLFVNIYSLFLFILSV